MDKKGECLKGVRERDVWMREGSVWTSVCIRGWVYLNCLGLRTQGFISESKQKTFSERKDLANHRGMCAVCCEECDMVTWTTDLCWLLFSCRTVHTHTEISDGEVWKEVDKGMCIKDRDDFSDTESKAITWILAIVLPLFSFLHETRSQLEEIEELHEQSPLSSVNLVSRLPVPRPFLPHNWLVGFQIRS